MTEEKKQEPIDEKKVTKDAASTVLDDVVLEATIKGIGEVKIKPMKLGTMLKISKLCNFTKPESTDVLGIIGESEQFIEPICKILAIAILNSRLKIFLFSKTYAKQILWNMNAKEIHTLLESILSISYAYDFFVTTVLLQGLSVTKSKTVTRENK